MNSPSKKAAGAKGIPQPVTQRKGLTHQSKQPVVQLKNPVSAQSSKPPVAPPVYKPQPVAKVLQARVNASRGQLGPRKGPPVSTHSNHPSRQIAQQKWAATPRPGFHNPQVIQRADRGNLTLDDIDEGDLRNLFTEPDEKKPPPADEKKQLTETSYVGGVLSGAGGAVWCHIKFSDGTLLGIKRNATTARWVYLEVRAGPFTEAKVGFSVFGPTAGYSGPEMKAWIAKQCPGLLPHWAVYRKNHEKG